LSLRRAEQVGTRLALHREEVLRCRRCPGVVGPPVCGAPVSSRIILVGQAPGPHEAKIGRPFGYRAGRTLFSWLTTIGVDEESFRARVYVAAVARCFPGKAIWDGRGRKGGDRLPSSDEIARCRPFLERELALQQPRLVIAVGRLAIEQVLGVKPQRLDAVVGTAREATFLGRRLDVVCLPHPSGLSSWPKIEPGRTLLARALGVLAAHAEWRRAFGKPQRAARSRS
jgi:uracil-DNA glycosylase